jgi:translation elongation factor EF-Tu-like GTPase
MRLLNFTYSGALAPREQLRARIYALEAELLELPQTDCPVVHHYAPGIYVREMTVPPFTVLTGAVHKTEHLAMLIQGRIEVLTEDGLQVLEAPCTVLSRPGIKRVGRTFEEGAVWSTIHTNPDDCRDMDVIVERLCTTPNSELLGNRLAALDNSNEGQKWL